MKFETYIPCDALKPYIKSFVIQETDESQAYKVLPDTGIVIGFQYKGNLSYVEDHQEIPLSTAGVTGIRDSYRIFQNTSGVGSVLVFFKDGGASVFFKTPIHEIFRESLSLEHFMLRSELLLLEEKLAEAKSDLKRIDAVEKFLLSQLHITTDSLVLASLSLIYKSKGNIRIKELAEQLHTSQSPLEKRFRKMVGTSPKKFASIVRMKHTISCYNPSQSLTELGHESGFYDQAHFIKEFKDFTGETPEQFFKR